MSLVELQRNQCTVVKKRKQKQMLVIMLHFFSEDCAKWCAEVGGAPKCKKWVFKEVGTICHLKYTLGDVRDDASPLTPEDLKLFQPADGGSNATAAASNNSTAGNSTGHLEVLLS